MDGEEVKVGDRVRSIRFGTNGYLHHVNERRKAWVSDHQDGSQGQYHDLEDLTKI